MLEEKLIPQRFSIQPPITEIQILILGNLLNDIEFACKKTFLIINQSSAYDLISRHKVAVMHPGQWI